jgi:hypothetical protein
MCGRALPYLGSRAAEESCFVLGDLHRRSLSTGEAAHVCPWQLSISMLE